MTIKNIFHDSYTQCKRAKPSNYKLKNAANHVVFCVDCLFNILSKCGRKCDEFIFFDMKHDVTGIYLVERKKNQSNNVKRVKEQLQGGACFITQFLENDPATEGHQFDFMPVLVSRGIKHPMSKQLIQTKILLHNKSEHIRHSKNNNALPAIKSPAIKSKDKNQ